MNIKKIFCTLLAAVLVFAACKEENENSGDQTNVVRKIVYAIGSDENQQTLMTDSEWNALLDHFLDCASKGDIVKFYNLSDYPNGIKGAIFMKDAVTISTTSRDEIKAWMRNMEREGKTVSVSYDERTGTWNGTAYATIPETVIENDCYTGVLECVPAPNFPGLSSGVLVPALRISDDSLLILVEEGATLLCSGDVTSDTVTICGHTDVITDLNGNNVHVLDLATQNEGAIEGRWNLVSLTITQIGAGDPILNSTVYVPQGNNSKIYSFNNDGTVTLDNISDGGTNTSSGTWSVSDDNGLCCDLLPGGGGCWFVNWLTPNCMILSRESIGTENGDIYYHLYFEIVPGSK